MSDFSDLSRVTDSLIRSRISKGFPLIYPEIVEGVQNQFTNVLLIERQVPDYQQFVDSVNSSTFPIVYSAMSSKKELLTLLQKMFTSISRIGIAFTSSLENNKTFLDCNPLFKEEETVPFSENVQFIIDVINEFSVTNIDYLACNTLNYPNWTNYYKILTQNTGVVVGASNDKTGNMKYGGDWTMESTGQDIELIYFTKSIEYYTYLLDTVTATIPVGDNPYDAVLDSTNSLLYVANYSSSSVSVVNTATDTVVYTIALDNTYPTVLALDSTNGRLYVGSEYEYIISVINTTLNPPTVVTTIAIEERPWFMVIDSPNNRLYVSIPNASSGGVVVINTTNNTIVTNISVFSTRNLLLDSLNNRLYVSNSFTQSTVTVINTTNNAIVTTFITGGFDPTALVLDSTNSRLYVANTYAYPASNTFFPTAFNVGVINTTNYSLVTTIAVGRNPEALVLNSITCRLYVANFTTGTVSVIDTATNVVFATIVVGTSPQGPGYYENSDRGMVLNSTTRCLYVVNTAGNYVSVIDTVTNTVVDTIAVGDFPLSLTLNSSTNRLYVTNYGTTTVSVITMTTPTTNIVCFNKHTKILTDKGYILIQDLRKGDLVKTRLHDYKPIDMICKSVIYHHASKERIKDQLYKCSKDNFDEIFEPLIITGSHSILVDDFTSNEQREKTNKVLGDIFITDDKYRLPACADERASIYEIPGYYTVYHMALENDEYYENYGIFANGLLVESCSKRYLKELSNMELIA